MCINCWREENREALVHRKPYDKASPAVLLDKLTFRSDFHTVGMIKASWEPLYNHKTAMAKIVPSRRSQLRRSRRARISGSDAEAESSTQSAVVNSKDIPIGECNFFDELSTELVQMIFDYTDVATLTKLRRVNRYMRYHVDSYGPYPIVIKNAASLLRALKTTKIITSQSISAVYHALISTRCEVCNNFGPFLFLPTSSRCCAACLYEAPEFQVCPIEPARQRFALTARQVKSLPGLCVIPATYSMDRVKYGKNRVVFSIAQARALAIKIWGSEANMKKAVVDQEKQRWQDYIKKRDQYLDAMKRPYRSRSLREPRPPKKFEEIPTIARESYHCVAHLPFPALNLKTGELEDGIWCRGCAYNTLRWERGEYDIPGEDDEDPEVQAEARRKWCKESNENESRAYLRSEWLEHAKNCEGSKALWKSEDLGVPWELLERELYDQWDEEDWIDGMQGDDDDSDSDSDDEDIMQPAAFLAHMAMTIGMEMAA